MNQNNLEKTINWNQTEDEINYLLTTLQRGYAEIDLDAIESNMDNMHANIAPGTRMMGVIKTNGYGHGAVQIAKVLEQKDYVFGYAVAAAEEGFHLRANGIKKPILVLGYTFPYSYGRLAKLGIRPAVFRYDMLDELDRAAKEAGCKIKVHVKVDTGMGRIGITPDDEGVRFVKAVLEHENVELEGMFTHFARADEYDKENVYGQITKFKGFTDRVEKELGIHIPIKHCSNSAGILELPEANMDMVRAGITLYGLMPSDEVEAGEVSLKAAMSLHSHISFIKTIHKGQSVSYGGQFTATEDTKVATVPLGYGDGYPRKLTGKGSVLVRGKRCPILGRVCMDQFMIDVSCFEDIKEGEEVVLMGTDGSETITAEELGELSGRFNYELVCLINQRVPRVYKYNHKVVQIESCYE